MKKKVLIGVLSACAVIGGCSYFIAYNVTQYNIEKSIEEVTEEQMNEINELDVTELKISEKGEYDFHEMTDFRDLEPGDIVTCSARLSNGASVVVDGYVVKGDEESIVYSDGTIKITIKE